MSNTDEANRPFQEAERGQDASGWSSLSTRFLDEMGWVLYLLALQVVFAVTGVILDVIAGPYSETTKLLHHISGMFGAVALIGTTFCIVAVLLWTYAVYT